MDGVLDMVWVYFVGRANTNSSQLICTLFDGRSANLHAVCDCLSRLWMCGWVDWADHVFVGRTWAEHILTCVACLWTTVYMASWS